MFNKSHIAHSSPNMAPKRSKNQFRRERAKLRKVDAGPSPSKSSGPSELPNGPPASDSPIAKTPSLTKEDLHLAETDPAEPQIENIATKTTDTTRKKSKYNKTKPESPDIQPSIGSDAHPNLLEEYASVFERFEPKDPDSEETLALSTASGYAVDSDSDSGSDSDNNSDSDSDLDSQSNRPVSKRQLRKINRIPIADLKSSTSRPLAVEWFDVDAPDPYMVVKLKTLPNAVDVPSHWQQKKDYLSSKRGVERPPFKLPKYIADTGISDMRNHDEDSLKKLQRDRVQPKMGKLDIDYQKLHDAFFKYQTKPKLLAFGEVYYEGREKIDANRHQIQHMRPGKISRDLRAAVGLPENDKSAPPWVVLMNEFGKPPAYSHCIIPGVDVEYSNLGYKLARDQDWEGINMVDVPWGKMEEGEETEEEEEEDEEEAEEEGEEEDDEEEEKLQEKEIEKKDYLEDENEPEKVDISEYSQIKTQFGDTQTTSSPTSAVTKESLYRVLKEKNLESVNDGLVENRLAYEIGDQSDSSHNDPPKKPKQTKTTSPALDGSDFKF